MNLEHSLQEAMQEVIALKLSSGARVKLQIGTLLLLLETYVMTDHHHNCVFYWDVCERLAQRYGSSSEFWRRKANYLCEPKTSLLGTNGRNDFFERTPKSGTLLLENLSNPIFQQKITHFVTKFRK